MEDFTRLPITQTIFLLRLVRSNDNIVTADSRGEGGTAKELHRKGYVRPFGVIGRRIRWKLNRSLSQYEISQLRDLVQNIIRIQYKSGEVENIPGFNKNEIITFQDQIKRKKRMKLGGKEIKVEEIDGYVVI